MFFSSSITQSANKGILDISSWDFEKQGPVKLDGEWEFYWEKFYSLEDINGIYLGKTYLSLPNTWNEIDINGETLGADGYATFRLKVLLPPNSPALAIRSQQQGTAFKIFVNGTQTLSSGEVGNTESESIPNTVPAIGYTPDLKMQEMEIIMHISNFHHYSGGVWNHIYLGSYQQISQKEKTARETDSFLAGLLFFIFIYHIGFYKLKRNDKSSIVFSFFFLLLFFRIITTGPALGIQFLHYLFPKEIHKRIYLFYYVLSILGTLSLFLPPKYFTYSLPLFKPFLFLLLTIIPYFLIRAIINKREYARSIFVSASAIILSNFHDILAVNEIIQTDIILVPYGIAIMALTQSYALLLKFSEN